MTLTMTFMLFTTVALEALAFLEANEARLNARARKLLAWLRRRYPVRETVYADDEIVVTKIPLA
jgi:hypothetical protein